MRWFIGMFAIAAVILLMLTDTAPPTLHAEDLGLESITTVSTTVPAGPGVANQVADLKDTLEKGLRARLPEDFAFVAKVVAMVNNNELPLDVVIGTYNWVRKNRSHKKYMMPYFQQVLRSRAAQLGIQV